MSTKEIGALGERLAVKHLTKSGYKILDRNFVAPHGEIDIIAKDGNYIVFVEVKRRKSDKFGLPREAVTLEKQRTIVLCAKFWLSSHKLYGYPVRFDVVEVMDREVTLLKDAFRVTSGFGGWKK